MLPGLAFTHASLEIVIRRRKHMYNDYFVELIYPQLELGY